MPLPINIEELITGKTVEWERIEFREGWNPQRTLHSICAFANDFNNWGGGYIILGVAEGNGKPVLPPVGLPIESMDKIQQELNNICRRILPNYFPIAEPVDIQNKKLLILWCPGGSNRPYKAPERLSGETQYFPYIRRFSLTVKPTPDEERELFSMSNRVPFDDQINHSASLNDFELAAIKSFLDEIKSDLKVANLSIEEISRRMNIAEGSNEYLLPKNVGLLFFGKNPQQYFSYAKIELVKFEDETGDRFTEKIFSGPLHIQLREALQYFKNMYVEERVVKVSGKAESDRFYNYPYEAFEESLCNAVYHRGYDDPSSIEVRVYPSRIDILSYPGPLPPLNKEKLQAGQFDVRRYRNRRVGDFLKELHLTEGRATGIPKIKKSLADNGSPAPVFETDDDRTYFKTTLKIHPNFLTREQVSVQVSEQANFFLINNLDEILNSLYTFGKQISVQVREQVKSSVPPQKIKTLLNILELCRAPQTRKNILTFLHLTNHPKNYETNILSLVGNELLEMTIPDKPKSPNQKYRTTEKGKKLLEIFSKYESN